MNSMDRGFSAKCYDLIAIDMDHTLVKYNLKNALPLSHGLIQKFLVQNYGYNPEITQAFCAKYCQKGLVIDKRRGNVLKLDSEFGVMSARHGFKELSIESTREVYGADDVIRDLRRIPDVLSSGTIYTTEDFDYTVLKDYYTSPSAQVYSKCVEVLDSMADNSASDDDFRNRYAKIWRDLYSVLCLMHDRQQFKPRLGGWYPELTDRPDRYLMKTSDRVKQLLKTWRQSGKHVVLVTSSNVDYMKHLMNYTFGDYHQWISCFDYVLTFARKPTFFTSDRPFLAVDSDDNIGGEVAVDDLKCGQIYSEGNWRALKELVTKKCSKADPMCLYIGDSFTDDCIVPNKYADCHTIGVVEELDEDNRPELDSKYWQSFLKGSDNNTTLWYDLLQKHTKLLVPDMDWLADYCQT